MFNKKRRFHQRGKSFSSEVKCEIIDSVLEAGGDSATGYFPGKWEDIGTKHKVCGKTVKVVWQRLVSTGNVREPIQAKLRGNPSKLGQRELNLIEAI